METNILYYIWVFLFGVCYGSFFNVCIYRIPLKKSIIFPASFCPNCSQPIKYYDNIPIISYVLLRGRCRNCGVRISLRYPLVELLSALLLLLLYEWYGLSFSFFIHSIFIGSLIIVTFIDFDHKIIPDLITLPLLGFGVVISWIPNLTVSRWDSLLGVLVGGGFLYSTALIYWVIRGKHGMGGGDIKLMAMVGSFLGPLRVLFAIFLGSILGSIIGPIYLHVLGKGRDHPIPFGPYLALGSVISLFIGYWISDKFFPLELFGLISIFYKV